MAKKTKSTKKVATAKKTELLRIESTSAYTSKKEWKVSSRKNWPLPDNPLLRHTEAKASLSHLGGGDPKRAEERAVAIVTTEAMGTTALALPGNGPVPPQVGANNWSQLGPMAIPNGQTYSAARVLVSGRVTAIAIDPTATNTIYIGTAQGGIWKTTDGGLSWDAKSDNEVSLAIGALALDPQLPQIIYAGTGEGNFSGDSYYGLGILKSVDGGNTWVNLAQSTFSGNRFSRIVIVPSTAGTASTDLFAATNGGLFRSTNGGNSWTQLTSGLPTSSAATDVVIDPSVPTTIYVGFWNRGIFKSTNANVAAPSFSQLITGLPVATAAIPNGISRIALSIAPSSSQTIFALMANNDNTNYPSHSGAPYNYAVDKFYVSIDGGTNWSAISLPGPVTDGIGGQGFYNLNVVVDPTTPDIVYLSGISLWKAVKSGLSWTITDIGAAFHPDNHAIAVRPGNHLAVYAGSDGGIYKTLNGGTTWDDSINKGLSIAQLEFIDQHPTSTAVVFCGTQDNGTEQYRGGPVFNHADDGDGGFVVVNQSNPTNIVSTYYYPSPKLSVLGGKFGTWTNVSNGITGTGTLFYPPLQACRTDANRLAIGTTEINIDISQGTGMWPTKVALPGIAAGEVISAISYVTTSLIYACTTMGKVYKLVFTTLWTATLISAAPLPVNQYIWDVSPLPANPNTIVVVFSGFGIAHVWQGVVPTVGVAAWTNISGSLPDIPVNALVIDPLSANRMFIGTDVGVFETLNGGTTWTSISVSSLTNSSRGLPNCAVFDLKMHEPTRILRAATHGRGLWERLVDAASTPAVDLYVRDHVMETARVFPTPSNVPATFEDPLRYIALGDPQYPWMCADIKIDGLEGAIPSYQMPVNQVDFVAFESKLQHRNPQRSKVNRVYVQVNNRGFQTVSGGNVKILYADASAAVPDLPADFWTAFPLNSTDTTQWKPIGAAQPLPLLKPGIPVILEFDWTPPATAAEHSCMLVVIDHPSDPIPAANKVTAIWTVITNEKRVGLKNLHLIDPLPAAPPASTILKFNMNGSRRAQTIQILPQDPALKISLMFTARSIPTNVTLRGLTPKAPTQTVLRALARKYGDQLIAAFDTTRVYTLSSAGKSGDLTAILAAQTRAIVIIDASSGGRRGANFSIVQREGQNLIGGSTFAMTKGSQS